MNTTSSSAVEMFPYLTGAMSKPAKSMASWVSNWPGSTPVSGAGVADSGWIAAECWTPPPLGAGTFFWKAFVRDARGYMNRTNQRPTVFKIQ